MGVGTKAMRAATRAAVRWVVAGLVVARMVAVGVAIAAMGIWAVAMLEKVAAREAAVDEQLEALQRQQAVLEGHARAAGVRAEATARHAEAAQHARSAAPAAALAAAAERATIVAALEAREVEAEDLRSRLDVALADLASARKDARDATGDAAVMRATLLTSDSESRLASAGGA